jgi:hypothetical protein
MTQQDIEAIFHIADQVARALGAPAIASVVLHAADDVIAAIVPDSEGKLGLVRAREQAAGASANKAAHLAGMREAIGRELSQLASEQSNYEDALDSIMAEVARRMP